MVEPRPNELSYAHGGVAFIQERQGDLEGARTALELALAMKQRIAAGDNGVDRQQDLAVAHNRLGVVLGKLGQIDQAFEHYRADLAIRRRLISANPANMALKTPLFVALTYLGTAHEGDLAAAMVLYDESLTLMGPLAPERPAECRVATGRHGGRATARRRAARARPGDRRPRSIPQIRRGHAADCGRRADGPALAARRGRAETGLAAAELAGGRLDAARGAVARAERVLLPAFERRPDADLGMLLGSARLVAADVAAKSGQAAAARSLRESALEIVCSVSGTKDTATRAVEARALLALGRIDEARPIVSDLDRLGYRHHQLTRAWRPYASGPRR